MALILGLLVAVLVVSDLFRLDLSLGPGLSVKNAVLYLVAFAVLFRLVISRSFKLELPGLHAAFAVLVIYAIISWQIVVLFLDYPRYSTLQSAVHLKARLVDHAIFFLAFFYGLRSLADVKLVFRTMVLVWGVANLLTIAIVLGYVDIGVSMIGLDGDGSGLERVVGALGNPNETGSLIVCLLPLGFVLAAQSGPLMRFAYFGATAVSIGALLLTASRGAIAGLLIGTAWAIWLCRRHVPARAVLAWGGAGALIVAIIGVVITLQFPDLLSERFVGQSRAADWDTLSSGRTTIWSEILGRMIESPVTFLSGFGWDSYDSMPFRYVSHNHYLWLWFELGIAGLVSYVTLLVLSIGEARRTLAIADAATRAYCLSMVFGALAFAVAGFFSNFYSAWLYFWAFMGAAMRMCVIAQSVPVPTAVTGPSAAGANPRRHGKARKPRMARTVTNTRST